MSVPLSCNATRSTFGRSFMYILNSAGEEVSPCVKPLRTMISFLVMSLDTWAYTVSKNTRSWCARLLSTLFFSFAKGSALSIES